MTSGMKRSLQIIMHEGEGCEVGSLEREGTGVKENVVADTGEKHQDMAESTQKECASGQKMRAKADYNNAGIASKPASSAGEAFASTSSSSMHFDPRSNKTLPPKQKDEKESQDSWLKFGMATLGVVVGGVLLNAQGGEDPTDKAHDSERSKQSSLSIVKIVETSEDDDDNDWVAITNATD